MSFVREQVADACKRWGAKLWVPESIDGPRLLWALSGCESSFGANCTPRHEMAYCIGIYSHDPRVIELTREFGHDAHCSFGPWQLLLVNASSFTTPEDFVRVDRCAMETASYINMRIIRAQKATTIEQIADAYNSGTWRDRSVPEKYIADCVHYYNDVAMPEAV
ncbi:MAG TPA: hypothetical protein VM554_15130 [Acidisarcina sp.]|nr:hypothetical protein [Acidisarcina sp.]